MNSRHKAFKIRHNTIKEIKGNASQQDNTKVKVQYIRNHGMIEKGTIGCSEAARKPTEFPAAVQHSRTEEADTEEAENVEYLDESTCEEQPFLESCETNAKKDISKPLKKFKDTFYPNAILCLIDLYKRKYLDMNGKTEDQIRSMAVWNEITEKMNECLFHFTRHQIKEKFLQLRQQYFRVRTLQEVDDFEYFDQLHDLYQDKYIDSIATGFFKQEESGEKRVSSYVDEVLLRDDDSREMEIDELHLVSEETTHGVRAGTNVDEIAHKEHEFIDMVEKELQAIDGRRRESVEEVQDLCTNELSGRRNQEEIFTHEDVAIYTTIEEKSEESESALLQAVIKREQSQIDEEASLQRQSKKRFKADTEKPKELPNLCSIHVQTQPDLMRSHFPPLNQSNDAEFKDMSLAEYNQHQERRHHEKLELFKKSLMLQERAAEMNRSLMEELIKRL